MYVNCRSNWTNCVFYSGKHLVVVLPAEIFQHDLWKEMNATAEKRRLVHLGHKVGIPALVTCADSTVKGHSTAITPAIINAP